MVSDLFMALLAAWVLYMGVTGVAALSRRRRRGRRYLRALSEMDTRR